MPKSLGCITADELRRLGADCGDVASASYDDDDSQFEIFDAEWPKGMTVTPKNVRRAIGLDLDLHWYIEHALPVSARKAYDKAMAHASKAYDKAAKATLAWAETEEARVQALKDYDRANAPAIMAHEKAQAQAFMDAYRLAKKCAGDEA